jgi:hypothetical protein
MHNRPADSARPRSRTWWFDPRFAIGIGLVVVSVVGMVFVVSAADSSVRVYSARTSLSPGDHIRASDLVIDSVRLGAAGSRYLRPKDLPAAGLVVTRAVAAGELLPTAAVGDSASVRVTSIVVPIAGQLARSIAEGTVVDLWSAHKTGTGVYAAPTVLVSAATVVRLIKAEGLIASGDSGAVEVLVPRSATARVLQAVSDDDAVSLVPSTIPVD